MFSSTSFDFRALGQLSVRCDVAEVPLGGPRQRLVLALLLLDAGKAVPAERLVDQVWGEEAPATGTGPKRTYVWQLRRRLDAAAEAAAESPAGPDGSDTTLLISRDAGYLLDIRPEQIDLVRFEKLFSDARTAAASSQPERALDLLDRALDLWRGPAFGDLATAPALEAAAARCDQLHLAAKELHAEMQLAIGKHVEVAAGIDALARANPARENLWALLMTALYRSGRQRDALLCFQEARTILVDEMGIEPGPELRDLEQRILSQDPALEWRPRGSPPRQTAGDEAETSTVPNNLPRDLTSFVGRVAERAAVAEAVDDARLVTLTGTGGGGKTRLARAVAGDVATRFLDGVWFVDLAAVSDPSLIPRAVAEPLGVDADEAGQLDHLCRAIADRSVLLVLDNCEHLVDSVAKTVEELLLRCPSLFILATSREELRVTPELVWRVPTLSLPEPTDDEQIILESEAVQLFIERGRAALGGFAPSGDALEAVVKICRNLDGVALALELAAALVGSLPLDDIASRLDDRLALLAEGRREGPERHRTLRATLDWSFELLDEPAQDLFAQLGVFVGDFTLSAAEAVTGSESDPLGTARCLGHLVRTSMIGCLTGSDGAERYRMLETIRQYAREQHGDCDDIHRSHARFYADLAAESERHVHGPAASEWLARVSSEMPNLRTAVAWAFSNDDLETAVRLAGPLRWFFPRMGLLDEAAGWLARALDRRDELTPELLLTGLTAASTVEFCRGEFGVTRSLGEESIELARKLGDSRMLAIALIVQGAAVVYEGDLERAEDCFQEAEVLCARRGDRWGTAWMLTSWAAGSRRAGQYERSRKQLDEALAIFRDLHDRHGQLLPLINLAFTAQAAGEFAEALELATEAERLATALGDRQLRHVALCLLGRLELARGDTDKARDLLVRSIRDFPGAHTRLMIAIALEGLAELAGLAGNHRDSAALWGFSHRLRERSHIAASGSRTQELDDRLHLSKDAIGAEALQLEIERGETMDLHDALDLAIASTR
jgi:predicted ATPase/DNA-binding SARP family transcriptional activator